ncbi:MAG TPA: hypothetical protein VL485_25040 [Ktedonobacteraceae bacterium]|nr:hypothetical protein [Ktedonobacteraceae bacterium]
MPGTHVPASLPAQGTLPGGTALRAIGSNTLPHHAQAIRVDLLLFSGNVLESMGLSATGAGTSHLVVAPVANKRRLYRDGERWFRQASLYRASDASNCAVSCFSR